MTDVRRKRSGRKRKAVDGARRESSSAPSQVFLAVPADAPAIPQQEWAQCSSCQKWRKLPLHINAASLPHVWTCTDNARLDPAFGSCAIGQEPSPDDDDHTVFFEREVSRAYASRTSSFSSCFISLALYFLRFSSTSTFFSCPPLSSSYFLCLLISCSNPCSNYLNQMEYNSLSIWGGDGTL